MNVENKETQNHFEVHDLKMYAMIIWNEKNKTKTHIVLNEP
jgi:hypothetical protein